MRSADAFDHASADEADRPPANGERENALEQKSSPDRRSQDDGQGVVARISQQRTQPIEGGRRAQRDELHQRHDEQRRHHFGGRDGDGPEQRDEEPSGGSLVEQAEGASYKIEHEVTFASGGWSGQSRRMVIVALERMVRRLQEAKHAAWLRRKAAWSRLEPSIAPVLDAGMRVYSRARPPSSDFMPSFEVDAVPRRIFCLWTGENAMHSTGVGRWTRSVG